MHLYNKFHDYNQKTIERLEKANIKVSYRNYLRIINNRIKLVLAKSIEQDCEKEDNNKQVSTPMDDEDTLDIMQVDHTRGTKRDRESENSNDGKYDEFSLITTTTTLPNDQ